ncbi:hypothetical protein ACLOJK_033465 [Asimina triloba]
MRIGFCPSSSVLRGSKSCKTRPFADRYSLEHVREQGTQERMLVEVCTIDVKIIIIVVIISWSQLPSLDKKEQRSASEKKMERGRGGRDFFHLGDPFAGFGGFGQNSFSQNPFSNIFENDPFFTDPFGTMFGSSPFGSSSPFGHTRFGPGLLGPSMLGPSMFASSMPGPSIFGTEIGPSRHTTNVLEHQKPQPRVSKGVVIKELSSDSEEGGEEDKSSNEKKDNPRKHQRLGKESYVQERDSDTEGLEERKRKHAHYMNEYNRSDGLHPQSETFSFQSSSVTYGGPGGAYYTSSTTRRMGGDGVVVEESKEADTSKGRATHRMSRGIHDKGHSVTRKLKSDGKVDTMQTLHNLNEDELGGFEKDWRGSARKHLPGWSQRFDDFHIGGNHGEQHGRPSRGWALPSAESPQNQQRTKLHAKSQQDSFNGRA